MNAFQEKLRDQFPGLRISECASRGLAGKENGELHVTAAQIALTTIKPGEVARVGEL